MSQFWDLDCPGCKELQAEVEQVRAICDRDANTANRLGAENVALRAEVERLRAEVASREYSLAERENEDSMLRVEVKRLRVPAQVVLDAEDGQHVKFRTVCDWCRHSWPCPYEKLRAALEEKP